MSLHAAMRPGRRLGDAAAGMQPKLWGAGHSGHPCHLLVFVGQAAESVVSSDVVGRGCGVVRKGSEGSGLAESAVRPVFVVVLLVLPKHGSRRAAG
jgi:hypothetical protein